MYFNAPIFAPLCVLNREIFVIGKVSFMLLRTIKYEKLTGRSTKTTIVHVGKRSQYSVHLSISLRGIRIGSVPSSSKSVPEKTLKFDALAFLHKNSNNKYVRNRMYSSGFILKKTKCVNGL